MLGFDRDDKFISFSEGFIPVGRSLECSRPTCWQAYIRKLHQEGVAQSHCYICYSPVTGKK